MSAVDVMILKSEPGATCAVRAKSLKPSLFAIARMSPVDGWMTTMELSLCWPTTLRAAASACGLIVVFRSAMLLGETTTAWLFGTALPFAVWISTYRPGWPLPEVPCCCSRPAMLLRPASLYEVRAFPLLSVTETICGATVTAARCWLAVRLGARTVGDQLMYHDDEFTAW